MDIFNRFVAAGRGLQFAARDGVSSATAELALEQVCLLLVILPADVLRKLRSRLDVEVMDYVTRGDVALLKDLERVQLALRWVSENASGPDVARQASDLAQWLADTLTSIHLA